ncbi:hypothetical protein [Novipirellula aureliae]|nr:hypothetical protein [Novipirellula aureliae]
MASNRMAESSPNSHSLTDAGGPAGHGALTQPARQLLAAAAKGDTVLAQ